jgi:two-component system, response regulator, stage 0 sporulation protein F
MASILVIDGEPGIRALLSTVLEDAGHTVVAATNGREGLALYRQQPTDLVVTDIHMPGFNLLDLLLELTREVLNVKVIAMSEAEGGQERVWRAAKLMGVRRTFQKPFSLQRFLAAVQCELAH